MKPTIKDIVASQSWIEEVKKSKAAMNAFRAWQTLMVPSLIKARIKKTASDANVPYEDVALMNLAYEASMVALAGLPPIRDLFLAAVSSGLPATSWGCSSFGVVEVIGDREMGGQHGRNLDWPDPGKILRDSTTVVKEGKMPYWTVGFPGQAGVLTGSADYRFSVSLNAVYTDKVGWGQAPVYLVRKALEECKDFNEALKLICKTRLMVGALFLLMEGPRELCDSRMVVIERTPDKYYIRRQASYGNEVSAIICTNDYIGITPKNAGVVQNGGELQKTSCGRYSAIERELKENPNIFKEDEIFNTLNKDDVKLDCTIHQVVMCPTLAEEPRLRFPQ